MFFLTLLVLCSFQGPPWAVSQNLRWRMAKGKHLFPFRTEQLSLSAPMVLGGQPPGRVGRRRFLILRRESIDRGAPGAGAAARAAAPDLARPAGIDRLEAVLAQGREVDDQVRGVGYSRCCCLFRIEHEFDSTVALGRLPVSAIGVARRLCDYRALQGFSACRRRGRGLRSRLVSRRWASGRRPGSASSRCRGRCGGIRPGGPAGSSTICSSAPISTISGFPDAFIRPVEALFVAVVLGSAGGVVVGRVGHPR